jgi:hypothetical protein
MDISLTPYFRCWIQIRSILVQNIAVLRHCSPIFAILHRNSEGAFFLQPQFSHVFSLVKCDFMKMTAIPFESMIIHIKHGGIIFHPCKALMHKNTILFSGHILKQH